MPLICFADFDEALLDQSGCETYKLSCQGNSSSLLALLTRFLSEPPSFADCLPCPEVQSVNLSSFLLGVSVGVVLLPVLEFVWLLRAAVFRRFIDSSYFRLL